MAAKDAIIWVLRMSTLPDPGFVDFVRLVQSARQRMLQTANTALIELYWQIGASISRRLEDGDWVDDSVISQLAEHLARVQPDWRGFSRRKLQRMRQFYECYCDRGISLSTLAELPWTHHRIILNRSRRADEREFYLRMAIREKWSSRELERQIEANLYAHCKHTQDCASSLSTAKTTALFDLSDDAYLLEFLDLPTDPLVNEIRSRLLHQLRNFFSAQGVNFCFVGAEYPLPLVGRDATIDLLFLHRGLNCLLAIEFQLDSRPENMLQMHLEYLAALDREVKKPHENPTIGVLLCADKNGETVDYSLERSLSPAQVANYHKYLPTRKALQTQLHELYLRYVAVTGSND